MRSCFLFFFFNDTATTEIYTLSLHDALPILGQRHPLRPRLVGVDARYRARAARQQGAALRLRIDRKSTRLNSSHSQISYAVFCLKKKKHQSTPKRHTQTHCSGDSSRTCAPVS